MIFLSLGVAKRRRTTLPSWKVQFLIMSRFVLWNEKYPQQTAVQFRYQLPSTMFYIINCLPINCRINHRINPSIECPHKPPHKPPKNRQMKTRQIILVRTREISLLFEQEWSLLFEQEKSLLLEGERSPLTENVFGRKLLRPKHFRLNFFSAEFVFRTKICSAEKILAEKFSAGNFCWPKISP